MKCQYLGTGGLIVLVLLVFGVSARAEENVEVLCTSPSGAYGNIYHLLGPTRIEAIGPPGAFNDLVWEQGVKLGALKENHSAAGVYAMTFFENWSFDSSRLLLRLCGGEKKSATQCGSLYFNTAARKFEVTPVFPKTGQDKGRSSRVCRTSRAGHG